MTSDNYVGSYENERRMHSSSSNVNLRGERETRLTDTNDYYDYSPDKKL